MHVRAIVLCYFYACSFTRCTTQKHFSSRSESNVPRGCELGSRQLRLPCVVLAVTLFCMIETGSITRISGSGASGGTVVRHQRINKTGLLNNGEECIRPSHQCTVPHSSHLQSQLRRSPIPNKTSQSHSTQPTSTPCK